MARINPLKRRLEADEAAAGVLITMPSVNLAQVLAGAGFDWLFIDMEHGAIDLASAHHLIAATAGTGCAPLVRVPRPDLALCKPVLDAGAMGVIFPMVCTPEQAEATVRCVKYPPEGDRGWGPFYAPARWGLKGPMEYFQAANREIANIVLIEHIDAVENIEAIMAVPGIDVATIAPMDLAVSMGHPGDRDHPEVVGAIERAERAILASPAALGGMALSSAEANAKIARGYRFLVMGYDVMLIEQIASQLLDGLRR
ncbi:2,4-dihydroxyhept-2-ene-1,7-dioic acid aldolase [Thalassobaculum fulvum]|uniref:2,4-dihydroxyhept-2-ene-1,7-dioic acid aldolase n=1 Tax=Thalassobaculum fulvum TaxID=1633335 RepID=A0A919CQ22_9PROT|nr:aldolase/citrate lyase family protein [Thalassobaculum fulvum]GHD52108.1 2,4-dihydroxyhept-2-ene-1,7-dioic acid aldolase [Thalassobaculum fulvum]